MLLFTSISVVPELHASESSTRTSSSSSVAPKFYTSKSSTSTTSSSSSYVVPKVNEPESSTSRSISTEKYIGLLKDENKNEAEYEQEQSTKFMKTQRKSGVSPTTKSKVDVEDKSEEKEEDPKESTVTIAVFNQQALDKVSNISNDFLILDKNNDLVVTGLSNRIFTTTKAHKKEEEGKPPNQAEESSHSERKRKSRIIEMDAHLDEHYYYPFMFQQHDEKQ
jgi:hypothetical protein